MSNAAVPPLSRRAAERAGEPPLPPIRTLVRTVTRLGIPTVLENMTNSLIIMADLLMLARLPNNSVFIAATAITGISWWRLANIAGCTQIGAGAYVARRWGEERFAEAGVALAHALMLSFVIGAVTALGVWHLVPFLFDWLAPDQNVSDTAYSYFQFLLLALPTRLMLLSLTSCMRAAGDTRTPLLLTLLILVTNVFLNWVFIFGNLGVPRMEMDGAGLGTALSYNIALLAGLFLLWRGLKPKRLIASNANVGASIGIQTDVEAKPSVKEGAGAKSKDGVLRFDPAGIKAWIPGMTRPILRVSRPSLGEETLVAIGFLTFLWMIGRFGTEVMAAHGAAVRIESLSYTAGWGISLATATMVGQALGAKHLPLARRMFTLNTTMAMVIMGSLGIFFVSFPDWLLGWFQLSPEAMDVGRIMMFILGIQQCFIGSSMTLTGGLRGAGDTLPTFLTQLAGVIGTRLGLGWFLAFHLGMGIEGVYWATAADWIMRTMVLSFFVWRGKWEKVEV